MYNFESLNIYRPNTTSRVDLDTKNGLKCVHYGDIYKHLDNKTIQSSAITNHFSKEIKQHKILFDDSIIMPDVTETISDFGHFVYIEYDGTPYINGTHTFAITGERNFLKYLFYNLQSYTTRLTLRQLLKGDTVFQLSYNDIKCFRLPVVHHTQQQQHIVDIITKLTNLILCLVFP